MLQDFYLGAKLTRDLCGQCGRDRFGVKIVSRKAADWRRRRVARGEEELLTEEPLAISGESENGAAAALSQALRKLSGERRALINLRYVEGFDVREMAKILDIPEGTVKSRLHSARQQIQDIMERSKS